ncbi:MAG: hypothetical protein IJJ15_02625 [Ruminococcus sp.]|nr:hypothetical protein [Ruminococcus sp.]
MKRCLSILLVLSLAALGCMLTACGSSASKEPTAASETAKEAEPLTEALSEAPTEPPTEAVDYKSLYQEFLLSTDISYDSGALIYLNDDDIPELCLETMPSSGPAYVCYILDGKVQSYETYATSGFSYGERKGCFSTGSMHQGYTAWMIYSFDGKAVSVEHSGNTYDENYSIDEESVSKAEYDEVVDSYDLSCYPEGVSKDSLQDLIENF